MKDKKPVKLYNIHILTILEKPLRWYIHIEVKKFWQQNGILYIKEKKSTLPKTRNIFRYGIKYIKELRVQEIEQSKTAHEIEKIRLENLYERQYEIGKEIKKQQEIIYKQHIQKQKKEKMK